jgi:hypothetical protein
MKIELTKEEAKWLIETLKAHEAHVYPNMEDVRFSEKIRHKTQKALKGLEKLI